MSDSNNNVYAVNSINTISKIFKCFSDTMRQMTEEMVDTVQHIGYLSRLRKKTEHKVTYKQKKEHYYCDECNRSPTITKSIIRGEVDREELTANQEVLFKLYVHGYYKNIECPPNGS